MLTGENTSQIVQRGLFSLRRDLVSTLAAVGWAQRAVSVQPSGTGQECLPHLLLCGADVLLSSFQLIQKGTKLVLEQVVTSIASVADTAEEKFVPYYDLFMPSLKHIVENAVQKELRLLRGKTIEYISLIGLAVGKEKVSDLSTMCWVCCVSSGFGGIKGTRGFFLSDKRFSEDLVVFHHLILVLL